MGDEVEPRREFIEKQRPQRPEPRHLDGRRDDPTEAASRRDDRRRGRAAGDAPGRPSGGCGEHRGRGPELVPRLLDVGDHQPRAARRARRSEARPPPHPLRDERGGPALRPAPTRSPPASWARCSSTTTPTATRGLRRHGADGPGLLAPLPAVDGQGNFGSIDGDSAGGLPLHRGPAAAAGRGDAAGHRPRDGRLRAQLRRQHRGARGAAGALPEPAGERLSGIAVGMATNVPPHNLRELVDALVLEAAIRTARSTTCSRRCRARTFRPAP